MKKATGDRCLSYFDNLSIELRVKRDIPMLNYAISLTVVSLASMLFVGVEAGEAKPYEMPRTHVVPIQDTRSDRQYELYIKLPESYETQVDQDYPVIYTTDAIWHFEMLSGATEYLMPNVILVGISWQIDLDGEWEYASRFRDYTVVKSRNPEHQALYQFGQASDHQMFIREGVIKFVEENYRADPGERAYFGYSMGSVFGAYILLAEPDTFRYYILGSPAFGQRSAEYIDQLEANLSPQQQEIIADVLVSIGELEESEMEVTNDFVSVLRRRRQAGLTVTGLEIIGDSNHGTAFPVTVIQGINWLSSLISE